MIRYLAVLNNHNGAAMFAQSFGCFSTDERSGFEERLQSIDPDVLGGFLQTLSGFGSRMFSTGHVESISFEGFSLMAIKCERITVIGLVEHQESPGNAIEILEEVAASFNRRFGSRIEDWDGDPSLFFPFLDTLIEEDFIDASLDRCGNWERCPPSKYCLPRLVTRGAGNKTK